MESERSPNEITENWRLDLKIDQIKVGENKKKNFLFT